MATQVPPKRGSTYSFVIPGLYSQADANVYITDPTLASGDFVISKDGGNPASLASLPTVINSGTMVLVALTGTEMTCDYFTVTWEDAADSEWISGGAVGFTVTTSQIDDLSTATNLATVDTNVDAVLLDTGTDGVVLANDAVTAAKIAANAITSSELAASAAQEIADETLKRGMSNVEDTADAHSLAAIVLAILESSLSGSTWTIKKTGGTTFVSKTITTDSSADPITSVT